MNTQGINGIESLTVHEFKKMREEREEGKDFYLLDVRTLPEKKFSDIGGDLLPIQEIENRYSELKGKDGLYSYFEDKYVMPKNIQ